MMLISAWLGGGPGSRLYEEIRGRRGIAYTLFTDHLQYSAVGALQFVMQTPESARADEAVQVATQIISGEEDNLSESEFALLKQEIIGQLDLSSDNAFHLMNLATSHLASYGYVRQLDDIVTRIEAVDLAELRATWHEFLRPELVCLSRLN
jgi:zinc protease